MRSVPELTAFVVGAAPCSSERLNREQTSASPVIPELRKLQARLKVSFSELCPQQGAFLNSKLSKRAAVFGRHAQFTLGME